MMYQRGPGADAEAATSVGTLSHLGAIATDLGADVVKLDYAGSVEEMNEVVDSCPLPVLVAGGPSSADDEHAIGFGAQRPDAVTAELAAHLNPAPTAHPALELV